MVENVFPEVTGRPESFLVRSGRDWEQIPSFAGTVHRFVSSSD